ncbi:MAG: cytochrome c [Comamonas sp.]
MKVRRLIMVSVLTATLVLALGAYAVTVFNRLDETPIDPQAAVSGSPELITRGAYLARIGDCVSCHTRPGGAAYAGGRAVQTPFGAVFAGNLTPDDATGLGRWNADEFWRALHHGRSRDGRLLYPAFPYPDYTHVTRSDADAIFAFLRSLQPVTQPTPEPTLRFPYNTQAALAVWRALYFRPAKTDVALDRGAYLVRGLGHCGACHTPRDALGGPLKDRPLAGALVQGENWWAPSLVSSSQAGMADWPVADIVALLTDGVSPRGGVSGPMAEVVFASLQHLSPQDARAMAEWLRALPPASEPAAKSKVASAAVMARGGEVYRDQCAQCHGDEGLGKAGAFPALAGNRAVRMAEPLNLIQIVLHGGYLPATQGNPRPFGMPPFRQTLSDVDVAAVLSFIRGSWDNGAGRVDVMDVHQVREHRG